jgi:hypothetical protein
MLLRLCPSNKTATTQNLHYGCDKAKNQEKVKGHCNRRQSGIVSGSGDGSVGKVQIDNIG